MTYKEIEGEKFNSFAEIGEFIKKDSVYVITEKEDKVFLVKATEIKHVFEYSYRNTSIKRHLYRFAIVEDGQMNIEPKKTLQVEYEDGNFETKWWVRDDN